MSAARDGRKIVAGAIFVCVGAFFAIMAQRFDAGTLARLGPGGFPMLLGIALALLGAANIVAGSMVGTVVAAAPASSSFGWGDLRRNRAILLIPLSVVGFAFVIDEFGLAIAIIVTVLIGSVANVRVRPIEVLLTCLVLVIVGVLLFVYGLGLPFSIGPPA